MIRASSHFHTDRIARLSVLQTELSDAFDYHIPQFLVYAKSCYDHTERIFHSSCRYDNALLSDTVLSTF